MREDLILMVDSGSDLPISFVQQPNVMGLALNCNIEGNTVEDYFGQTLDLKSFYDNMRNGKIYTTSQVNTYKFEEAFEKLILDGKSVIYLGLSSGLSGTANNAFMAINNLKEKYPNCDITAVDTLSASMGIGFLAIKAYEMMKADKTIDEIGNYIENVKLKVNHYFTVDDLHHLKKGGRVSSTAATVGTLLDIKPILHVDNAGKLIPLYKARGRKKSIHELAKNFAEKSSDEMQLITISHGDCYEEAKYLEELCRKNGNVKECVINILGPTIGSHTGAGVLALFFESDKR